MKRTASLRILCALAAALAVSVPAASAPSPCPGDTLPALEVTIDGSDLSIAGGTPGGRLLIVSQGSGWSVEEFATRFTRSLRLLKADERGSRKLEGKAAGDRAWMIVDVESGRCGSVGARSIRSKQNWIGRDRLEGRNGAPTRLRVPSPLVQGIVIRPGLGLWELTTGDGGPDDADFDQNGTTSIAFERMKALGTSGAPPARLEYGDVVLALSPHQGSMEFTRVEK